MNKEQRAFVDKALGALNERTVDDLPTWLWEFAEDIIVSMHKVGLYTSEPYPSLHRGPEYTRLSQEIEHITCSMMLGHYTRQLQKMELDHPWPKKEEGT